MSDRLKQLKLRLTLGGLAFVAIVGLGIVPMVAAASPTPSTAAPEATTAPTAATAPGSAPASPALGKGQGLAGIRAAILRGTVRAEATVVRPNGTTVLVHYERGRISAVTATAITIEGRDGKGASFVVTDKTRVRANGQRISYSDLKVGDQAMVFGFDQGGTYTAVLIRRVQPATPGA